MYLGITCVVVLEYKTYLVPMLELEKIQHIPYLSKTSTILASRLKISIGT